MHSPLEVAFGLLVDIDDALPRRKADTVALEVASVVEALERHAKPVKQLSISCR